MRVIGFILVAILVAPAGSASTADDRQPLGLARFAYANTLAFQTSFDASPPASPHVERKAAPGRLAELALADQRPLTLVATNYLPEEKPEPSARTYTLLAEEIEAIDLVRDVVQVQPSLPPAQRLAALPDAPDEIEVREARLDKPAVVRLRSKRPRHAHARKSPRHARRALRRPRSTTAKQAKVPRWARKMFESSWQQYAFSYQ